LHGRDIRDGNFDAWIERDDPRRIKHLEFETGWAFPSFFSKETAVDHSSVNSLASGHSIISVANYDEHSELIHNTSSQGPTSDGRSKPEIAAPGTDVKAANGFDRRDKPWVSMTGTSMASPFVTGVVGLMLSHDRKLTAAQIAGILRRSAKPLPSSDYSWKDDAGFGLIDPDICLRETDEINKRRDRTK
jgi:subtilisin family serine protease